MNNIYLPEQIRILNIKEETPDIKSFTFGFEKNTGEDFNFIPGQFIELSVFGCGEAPFSIVSKDKNGNITTSIKKTGYFTENLFKLKKDDLLGIRGPFGNGFPLEKMKNHDILIIGGGIGLAPLKSLIMHILSNIKDFGKIIICYGARTDLDIVYKEDIAKWQNEKNIKLLLTVDCPKNESWKCNIGSVANLLSSIQISPKSTQTLICGPTIMISFVLKELEKHKLNNDQIHISMERMMKCGVGKCGHCTMGELYTCQHGPVFTLDQIKDLL